MKNSKSPPKEKRLRPKKKVTTYSGKIESDKNRISFKSDTVQFGFRLSILVYFGFGHYGSGLNWVGSFRVMLRFRFRSILDRFTSDVRVQIGSSYRRCRFGYGFESFGSDFGSRVNFVRSTCGLGPLTNPNKIKWQNKWFLFLCTQLILTSCFIF